MKNKQLLAAGLIVTGVLIVVFAFFDVAYIIDKLPLIPLVLLIAGFCLLVHTLRGAWMGSLPTQRTVGNLLVVAGMAAAACLGLYDRYGFGGYYFTIGWLTVALFPQALGDFIANGPRFRNIFMSLYAAAGMTLFAFEYRTYWYLSQEAFFAALTAVALISMGLSLLAKRLRKPDAFAKSRGVRFFRAILFGCFLLQILSIYAMQHNWPYWDLVWILALLLVLLCVLCVVLIARLKRLEKRLLSAFSEKESNPQET